MVKVTTGARPHLISWDMDGTLYPVGTMLYKAFWKFFSDAWQGQLSENWNDLKELCQYHCWFERVRKTGGHFNPTRVPFSVSRFTALQSKWYGTAIANCGLRPGISEFLDYLAQCKIPCVLFSDYQSDYKLEALGLEGVFQECYEGIHLGAIKPAPDALLKMACDFRISPDRILHLGNRRRTDAAAARAAGCSSLILDRDFKSCLELLFLEKLSRKGFD